MRSLNDRLRAIERNSLIIRILDVLALTPVSLEVELETQEQLAGAFERSEIPFNREWNEGVDGRVDFMFDYGIALEVKLKGNRASIARQCRRYLASPAIVFLILATNRSMPHVGTNFKTVHLGRAHL